jgi:hypothetical protein
VREAGHLAGRSGLRAWASALVRTQSPGLPVVVEAVRRCTHKPLNVHLIDRRAERYLPDFAKANIGWGWFNGKIADSDSVNPGSNPGPPAS